LWAHSFGVDRGFAPNSEIVIGFGPFDGDVYESIGQIETDVNSAFTTIVSG